jgi:hypothetical protein
VEDFIILSLSQRQPLSAKELFGEVKRHGVDVSYQAVHKKLQELQKQRVLSSDGKRYSINRKWVLDAKVFLEKMDSELLKSVEKAERKEAVCLSFDSYNDFGTHMLREFAKERELEPGGVCVTIQKHFWWIFSVSKEDYSLLKKLGGSGKSYITCEGRSLVDKLLLPVYKKFGWKIVTGAVSPYDYDLVVYRDWVHQVFYSPSQKKFVERVCGEVSKPEQLISDFHQKYFENKGKIKVIIFKDRELARQLRADALQRFKKK